MSRVLSRGIASAYKQLQCTVMRRRGRGASESFHYASAPRWLGQRAAAEMRGIARINPMRA